MARSRWEPQVVFKISPPFAEQNGHSRCRELLTPLYRVAKRGSIYEGISNMQFQTIAKGPMK